MLQQVRPWLFACSETKSEITDLSRCFEALSRQHSQNGISFDAAFQQVHGFHQRLFSGLDVRAVAEVKKLYLHCIPQKNLLANCMEQSAQKSQEHLLEETANRLGVRFQTEAARKWILKYELEPVYQRERARYSVKL